MTAARQYEIAGLNLLYKPMTRSDMQAAWQILFDEGWTTALKDVQLAYDAYPDSYRGLYLADSGQLLGFCLAVIVNDQNGLIPFLAVHEAYRGKGLGTFLLRLGMEFLGERNIILDSLTDVCGFYRTFGFKEIPFAMQKYVWTSLAPTMVRKDNTKPEQTERFPKVVDLGDIQNVEKIIAYDRTIHPICRETLLRLRLSPEIADQKLSKIAEDKDGKIVGILLVFSQPRGGFGIGPLYADDLRTAEALLQEMHWSVGVGVELYGYAPNANEQFHKLFGAFARSQGDPEMRMETKAGVVPDLSKVFMAFNDAATLW